MQFAIIDGHGDTAQTLFLSGQNLQDGQTHINLTRLEKLGDYAQFFAYCPAWNKEYQPRMLYKKSRKFFLEQIALHEDKITLCGNTAQMNAAWDAGKIAAFFALEGAEGIDFDPGRLEEAYLDGVRMVTLTWNSENPLGGTNATGGGLTVQGRDFVRRAQKLGMIVDVSHASDEVFFDVADIAEKPFVASHSNCRVICKNRRNLTDEQIRCLAEIGGTMGLNLYSPFLSEKVQSDFEDVRRHLEHILEVAGEKVPALGGDLDGCDELPEGFSGVDNYKDLTEYLQSSRFSSSLLRKICSGNLMRVMDACDLRPV